MMLKPVIIFGFRLIRDIFVRILAAGLYVLGSFFPFVGQLLWPTVRPDTGAAKFSNTTQSASLVARVQRNDRLKCQQTPMKTQMKIYQFQYR
jgi:hypothetical protein